MRAETSAIGWAGGAKVAISEAMPSRRVFDQPGMVMPPLTEMVWPVTKPAPSLAR